MVSRCSPCGAAAEESSEDRTGGAADRHHESRAHGLDSLPAESNRLAFSSLVTVSKPRPKPMRWSPSPIARSRSDRRSTLANMPLQHRHPQALQVEIEGHRHALEKARELAGRS